MCDAIHDTSDLIQKIGSSCDTSDLVDANNDYVHASTSSNETQNDDLGDTSKVEPHNEDYEIDCFVKNAKGIGYKLMHKMGFDGKCLRKYGKGI